MFLAGEVTTPVTEETTTPKEESKDVVPASTEETPGGQYEWLKDPKK